MIKSFFWSKKWFWWAWGGGLLLLISLYFQVSMTVKFNAWYGDFYNILQKIDQHTYADFYRKLVDFMWIAMPLVALATITAYFTRIYSFRWREAITFDYIPRWRNVREEIEGASQRIQEDAYRFARIVETLGLQVARAFMTLIAFLPILWFLSNGIDIKLHGTDIGHAMWFMLLVSISSLIVYRNIKKRLKFRPPDNTPSNALKIIIAKFSTDRAANVARWTAMGIIFYLFWLLGGYLNGIVLPPNIAAGTLVWIALYVSVVGTWISWIVGIKLPGLEYNNQKVEAAFRKELVYGEDDKINYASIPTLTELFTGIRHNYHRLFWHYGYFDLWSYSFSQIMVIIPYIIGGPALFAGAITLGVLVQVSNAFDKVQGSFALFMENWTTVTEVRSIKKRLNEFEANLDKHRAYSDNEDDLGIYAKNTHKEFYGPFVRYAGKLREKITAKSGSRIFARFAAYSLLAIFILSVIAPLAGILYLGISSSPFMYFAWFPYFNIVYSVVICITWLISFLITPFVLNSVLHVFDKIKNRKKSFKQTVKEFFKGFTFDLYLDTPTEYHLIAALACLIAGLIVIAFSAITTLIALPIFYILNLIFSFAYYKTALAITWFACFFITVFAWNIYKKIRKK